MGAAWRRSLLAKHPLVNPDKAAFSVINTSVTCLAYTQSQAIDPEVSSTNRMLGRTAAVLLSKGDCATFDAPHELLTTVNAKIAAAALQNDECAMVIPFVPKEGLDHVDD